MRQRLFLTAACFVCLIVAATLPLASSAGVRASRVQAKKLPIHATLSAATVHAGEKLSVDVTSAPNSSLLLQVVYASKSGFKKKGKTNGAGHWAHSWTVHTSSPGPASAALTVQHGSQHRHFTLHFAVKAVSSPTLTATPTPTSTATPTATMAPNASTTPTVTATSSPTPTATAIPRFVIHSVKGTTSVIDNQTRVNASTSSYTPASADKAGQHPGSGKVFFFILVSEANDGTAAYLSTFSNFTVHGSDGSVYTPIAGQPANKDGTAMPVTSLHQGERNGGWIEIKLPAKTDTYTVVWNEGHTVNVGLIGIKLVLGK